MNDRRNASGCDDPTPYEALRNIQTAEINRQAEYTIRILKKYLYGHGFELIGRIPIRHLQSGREFR